MKMPKLDRRFFDHRTPGNLFGLLRQNRWRHWPRLRLGISGANLRFDFLGANVAHDHKEHIVRRVLLLVISVNVFPANLVEDIWIADDRESIRAAGIRRLEE